MNWWNAGPGELPSDHDWDERPAREPEPMKCIICGYIIASGEGETWFERSMPDAAHKTCARKYEQDARRKGAA